MQDTAVNVNQPGVVLRSPSALQLAVWRAQRIVYYLSGLVEALIALRLALKLVGANPANPFTQAIYGVSWVFVFPFSGIVPNINLAGGAVLETFLIVALIVYSLASLALVKLLELLV